MRSYSTFSPSITALNIVAASFVFFLTSALLAQTDVGLSSKQVAKNWEQAGFEFPDTWKPVIDRELAQAWGKSLEAAVASGDLAAINKHVEFGPLVARCVDKISNQQFKSGFGQGIKVGRDQLFRTLADKSGTYRYLRIKQTEFGASALLRMIDPNGGCNYHLWRLQQDSTGRVFGVDMYIFLSGESFADTMRRMAVISAPSADRTFIQKLTGQESKLAENQKEILKLVQGVQRQDFPSALASFKKLPKQLQQEKPIMLMRVVASMKVSDEEYLNALSDFRKMFPEDAGADLASIDLFFLNKQFDEMHAAIDRLEQAVGKDAYLCVLRAVGHSGNDQYAKAKDSIRTAIEIEPKMESAYWTMVEIALGQKDHPQVTASLKQLSQIFGYNEFDLASQPIYADYVKSSEYPVFQKYLKTINN